MCATDIPADRLVGAARAVPDRHAAIASSKERLAVSATTAAEPVGPLHVSVLASGRPETRVHSPVPSSA